MHIDWWTLALQAINVLILVWILARFFYRPVSAIIEQRRAAAARVLADAAAMRAAAEAEKADIQATRDGFAAERDRLLSAARKEIESERTVMLAQASERMEALRSQNVVLLARERAAMERAVVDRAGELAVQIAQRLLERLPPAAALAAFFDALTEQIAALPVKSRELLAAAAADGTLAVTTANALNEVEQGQCRMAIQTALGREPKISFLADTRLIAGVELSAGALVLKNTWANDLVQILAQLNGDDRQLP